MYVHHGNTVWITSPETTSFFGNWSIAYQKLYTGFNDSWLRNSQCKIMKGSCKYMPGSCKYMPGPCKIMPGSYMTKTLNLGRLYSRRTLSYGVNCKPTTTMSYNIWRAAIETLKSRSLSAFMALSFTSGTSDGLFL